MSLPIREWDHCQFLAPDLKTWEGQGKRVAFSMWGEGGEREGTFEFLVGHPLGCSN